MYILSFENDLGQSRKIGKFYTKEEVWNVITEFLKDHNFKSYYQRIWKIDDRTEKIDVGSYTEFFYITEEINE